MWIDGRPAGLNSFCWLLHHLLVSTHVFPRFLIEARSNIVQYLFKLDSFGWFAFLLWFGQLAAA
jgi:hypothetical protein